MSTVTRNGKFVLQRIVVTLTTSDLQKLACLEANVPSTGVDRATFEFNDGDEVIVTLHVVEPVNTSPKPDQFGYTG